MQGEVDFCEWHQMNAVALVRNLQSHGVSVMEQCMCEIERFSRVTGAGTLQRIAPLVE